MSLRRVEIECWQWGGGLNSDLISFLTEDNISTFCYRGQRCSGSVADRLSPASALFDLVSSGNTSHPLRQAATWDKITFLTFTHVSKQDDNAHSWLYMCVYLIWTTIHTFTVHILSHTHTTEDHLISECVRGGNPIV